MSQASLNRSTMASQIPSFQIHSSQSAELSPKHHSIVENGQQVSQTIKNRRWSQEEHILFLIFLEENRQKLKSKLIRRSNAFFREMAAFIQSKNSTQCRSYHQKFELKYKFPHRIIRQEREKVDSKLYQQIWSSKRSQMKTPGMATKTISKVQSPIKSIVVPAQAIECQTELQGVSTIFIQQQYAMMHQLQMRMLNAQSLITPYPFFHSFYPHLYFQG